MDGVFRARVSFGEHKGTDCLCAWYARHTQTHLTEVSQQDAMEVPRERRRGQEKCLFSRCLRDTRVIIFLCFVAHVVVCFRFVFI